MRIDYKEENDYKNLIFRYLYIQLEKDNPNYDPNYHDALEYIAQLPFEAVS